VNLEEASYKDGMTAGVTEAETGQGSLPAARVITGRPAAWVAGYQAGRAKVHRARHLAAAARNAMADVPPEICPLCSGKVRFGRCREQDCTFEVPAAADSTINHDGCDPSAHDRSLPDDGGRPYDQPYDSNGFLSDKQSYGPDGLLACNDCGRPLFYCRNAEWYFHVDKYAGCFLTGPWGQSS
jgi:hypothetical protein